MKTGTGVDSAGYVFLVSFGRCYIYTICFYVCKHLAHVIWEVICLFVCLVAIVYRMFLPIEKQPVQVKQNCY